MADLQSQADAPGKSREYETIFILTPDTPNDGVAKVNERLKGIVETMGGSVINVDNWGKRKLAYEIAKQLKGIYLYWQYLGTAGLVEELERNLRMLDPVIRYHTVKLDADIDPNARPTEMDDEAYARAAETAADEEDLVMGTGSGSSDSGDYEASGEDFGDADGSSGDSGDSADSADSADSDSNTENKTDTPDDAGDDSDKE